MNNQTPEPPPKKKTNPILIILYISLGLAAVFFCIFEVPKIISTGTITLGNIITATIFIPNFVIIFIIWGLAHLIINHKRIADYIRQNLRKSKENKI